MCRRLACKGQPAGGMVVMKANTLLSVFCFRLSGNTSILQILPLIMELSTSCEI